MLKQLIDDVRADHRTSNTTLWYYRISGNIVECIAHPSYYHNRMEYRSAVISVGQAIHSLTKRLQSLGLFSLTQSFPSLERPELIASVRYNERSDSGNVKPASHADSADPGRSAGSLGFLKMEAVRQELNVLPAPKDFSIPSSRPFTGDTSSYVMYLLTSRFDNPFYWLKTGYWKENTNSFMESAPPASDRIITDFISFYSGIKQTESTLQKDYIQAGIYLFGSPEKVVV